MYSERTPGALPKYVRAKALKILVVDDSASDVFLFEQLVNGIDDIPIELNHTTDYAVGLGALGQGTYDLAFIDYVLGVKSGPELIEAAGGRLCPTPLVLLTGQSGPDAEQSAIQAGAVDFVDKATMSSDLLRRVIRYARYNHNSTRELAMTQERYRNLAESAIEANARKSRFFAEMSHELRTPLNAIIGFSEIMKQQMLGGLSGEALDRYVEYTDDIHASSSHLLSLIDNLLDLAKMEAGHYQADRREVSLPEVIDQLLRMVRLQAENAGISLDTELQEDMPQVVADSGLLTQAILNVVSNAIKFTEPGGTVLVGARAANDNILIDVRDSGCGISPEDMKWVLLPYRQGSPMHSRPGGGTGLGLTLTNSIMELHGGRVEISSEIGVGTSVVLRLPMAPSKAD